MKITKSRTSIATISPCDLEGDMIKVISKLEEIYDTNKDLYRDIKIEDDSYWERGYGDDDSYQVMRFGVTGILRDIPPVHIMVDASQETLHKENPIKRIKKVRRIGCKHCDKEDKK